MDSSLTTTTPSSTNKGKRSREWTWTAKLDEHILDIARKGANASFKPTSTAFWEEFLTKGGKIPGIDAQAFQLANRCRTLMQQAWLNGCLEHGEDSTDTPVAPKLKTRRAEPEVNPMQAVNSLTTLGDCLLRQNAIKEEMRSMDGHVEMLHQYAQKARAEADMFRNQKNKVRQQGEPLLEKQSQIKAAYEPLMRERQQMQRWAKVVRQSEAGDGIAKETVARYQSLKSQMMTIDAQVAAVGKEIDDLRNRERAAAGLALSFEHCITTTMDQFKARREELHSFLAAVEKDIAQLTQQACNISSTAAAAALKQVSHLK